MPVTICAAMRVGSTRTTGRRRQELLEPVRRDDREERRAERDEQVRADPGLAVAQLALDADRRAEPRGDARAGATTPSRRESGSRQLARSIDRLLLERGELLDPGRGEVEQLVEPRAVERHRSAVACTSTKPSVAGHDDVRRRRRRSSPPVVEVEQRLAVDDADRHGRRPSRSAPSRARSGRARARAATYAPQIAAQRVPPSACSTSQSS